MIRIELQAIMEYINYVLRVERHGVEYYIPDVVDRNIIYGSHSEQRCPYMYVPTSDRLIKKLPEIRKPIYIAAKEKVVS